MQKAKALACARRGGSFSSHNPELLQAAAELRSAWTAGGGGNPWTGQVPVPTRAGAVMGVTVFCEIRIPIPGPVDAAITMEALLELERLLQ